MFLHDFNALQNTSTSERLQVRDEIWNTLLDEPYQLPSLIQLALTDFFTHKYDVDWVYHLPLEQRRTIYEQLYESEPFYAQLWIILSSAFSFEKKAEVILLLLMKANLDPLDWLKTHLALPEQEWIDLTPLLEPLTQTFTRTLALTLNSNPDSNP